MGKPRWVDLFGIDPTYLDGEPAERVEWRVVGEPGRGFPSYNFTFESEEKARGFAALIAADDHAPWDDGPHLESRTVTETPWERS